VSISEQVPLTAVATVDAGEVPPSEVWKSIATSDGFQSKLARAVRTVLSGAPYYERSEVLQKAGVTAANGGYARVVAGLDRGPETEVHQQALKLTAGIGQAGMTMLGDLGFDALPSGPLAVFDATDTTPTIAIRLGGEFRERRRDQREETLSLLVTLSEACDVRVVATGLTARWLAHEHSSQLPTDFAEECSSLGQPDTAVDELVAEARSRLDPDSRAVSILRDLANEPGETLPYHGLRAQHSVSDSRVSQILGTLEDLKLAERVGPRSNKRVELRPAGSALLDVLDAEIGRQAELDSAISDGRQDRTQAVYSRAHEGPPTAGGSGQQPVQETDIPFRTRWLARRDHAPAVASSTDGGITAVQAEIPDAESVKERRTRYISYDADRDEAVIAVRATGPLQYVTSVALALASPRFFDAALPVDRLEDIDDPPAILRDARCIGALSSEAEDDPQQLRDALVEWGEALGDMTRDLRHEQYEDRSRFRGSIVRSALGLAGTVIHLLDIAGVDIVRELRVPGGLDSKHLDDLARIIAISTAIGSTYGAFAVYRQLFETREDKRKTALTPDVDTTDRVGRYIGSLVLRGPDVDRLVAHVQPWLSEPRELHEDAPNIAVRVPIDETDRSTYAETVQRMCKQKSLKVTSEAVTLFRTFTGDPYAVSEALDRLEPETFSRDIRLDEVRTALSCLDPDQLLPATPPTVSKLLAVLFRTARPLSRSELAKEADVTTRSVDRHLGALVALDAVREVGGKYRLTLSDRDTERGEDILPGPVDTDWMTGHGLLFAIALELATDTDRVINPDDPLGEAFHWPQDFDTMRTELPALRPWIRIARDLAGDPDPPSPTVRFGSSFQSRQLLLAR